MPIAFEIGIRGFFGDSWDGKLVIEAITRGKAKSEFIRRVGDSWDVPFTALSSRKLTAYVRPPTPEEIARRDCEEFNSHHPIGTLVRYWTFTREGEPSGVGRIKHEATVVSQHASAWIEGARSSISITHVERVS